MAFNLLALRSPTPDVLVGVALEVASSSDVKRRCNKAPAREEGSVWESIVASCACDMLSTHTHFEGCVGLPRKFPTAGQRCRRELYR